MAPVKGDKCWRDPALGRFYALEPLVSGTGRARYLIRGTSVEFEYAGAPASQYYDGHGNLSSAAAIRAQLTQMSTGLQALAEFHDKGNLPENKNVTPDGPALYAEYYQLLAQGLGPRADHTYRDVLDGVPWVVTNLGQAYNLTATEELAMWAYSQPDKNVPMAGAVVNPTYMFSHPRWGAFGDGWGALRSALGKLPSLGQLGLGEIPLFRVERALSNLMLQLSMNEEQEIYIYHGLQTNTGKRTTLTWPGPNDAAWSAELGDQPHYGSASIAPSSHSWQQKVYKKGILRFVCPSAQYINAWGGMGILDGGEVLIPPGTVTYYNGIPAQMPWMGGMVTMYTLTEVTGSRTRKIPMLDDYTGDEVKL
jgi:hypothetical protein